MTPPRVPLGVANACVLGLIVVAGMVNLPVPIGTDQSFFTTGARQLLAGGVLYRDFWDLKQPGIFWFYLGAGRIAGFHEFGIHAIELGYMVAFATVLLVTLRGLAGSWVVARLAPLLTVGFYYAACGDHLTQIEGLVGFPMYLCLCWALRSTEQERGAWGLLWLSGVAGGVVLLLKLIFLPILLGIWLVALRATDWSGRRPPLGGLWRWWAAIGVGLALPLGTAALVLGVQGGLAEALRTFFVYPTRLAAATRGVGVPGHLAVGVLWFGERFGPVLALALAGSYARLAGGPSLRPPQLLARGLVAWVATGALVIVLQRKWWPYHFLILLVPLGILAAMGVEIVWRRVTAESPSRPLRLVVATVLALTFLAPLALLGQKAILFRHGLPWASRDEQLRYADRFNWHYVAFAGETAFLHDPASLPGAIHVFGDPLYYYLAGRRPAATYTGFWTHDYDAATWAALTQQLAQRLPAYIFVDHNQAPVIAEHTPRLIALLADRYRVLRQTQMGTWHERVTPARPAGGDPQRPPQ